MDASPSEIYMVKVISPRPKVTGAKCYARMHLSPMGSPQAYIGYAGINTMDTVESTRITRSRPKVAGPKLHAHAHLCLMGNQHAQTGHTAINTLHT